MAKIDLDFFEKVIFQQCLLTDGEYLAACVEYLDKGLFKNRDIAAIIDLIKIFYLENNTIPSLTELKTKLTTTQLRTNFVDAVGELRSLDKNYNQGELIRNTEYFLKQRNYYNLLENSVNYFADKKELSTDDFNREIERINTISLIDNLGIDYFGDTEKLIEYFQQKDTFISTGYRGLDDAFGGGFFKEGKAFYCIGGETNVGKSIFLANLAVNSIIQNYNTVIFTLEMSELRYAKRISSILTGIALASLGDKIGDYREFITEFKNQHFSKLQIKEFPTRSVSAKNLYAYCQALKRKKSFEPHMMVFDYHTLLKPSVTQPSKHAELQYVTQESRGLTYLLGCPAVSVAQLNRGSHRVSSPGLDNISGSWDMMSDVDGHANIWQTDEDREMNRICYSGKKSRDGAKGHTGSLHIDYNTLRLTEDDYTPLDESEMPENNITEYIDFGALGS
jgi:replicative DNA helicase